MLFLNQCLASGNASLINGSNLPETDEGRAAFGWPLFLAVLKSYYDRVAVASNGVWCTFTDSEEQTTPYFVSEEELKSSCIKAFYAHYGKR